MKSQTPLVEIRPDLGAFPKKCLYGGADFHFVADLDDADWLCHQIMDADARHDQVFKCVRRRNVFACRQILVKKYVFSKLSDVIHSHRYGMREFTKFQYYERVFGTVAGIHIPRLLGYFQKRKLHFFYSTNGVVMEFIPDTRFLSADEFKLAAPLFANHYRKGIYNSDLQYLNLLIQDGKNQLYPIDFMGCNFFSAPNLDSLFLQLARFCQTADVPADAKRGLLDATLALLPELSLKEDACWDVLGILMNMVLPTHQHNNALQLPAELKQKLA